MVQTMDKRKLEIIALIAGVLLGILGFVLPLRSFVIAVFGLAIFAAIMWKVEIGVFLTVALMPLSPKTIPVVGLIILTAVSYIVRMVLKKDLKFRITPIDVFILILGGIFLYGGITSYVVMDSMKVFLIYASFIVFYFVLLNTIKTKKQLYALVALLILSAFLVSMYGIYQYKTGGETSEAWVDKEMFQDITNRVVGTFENPNVLGEFLLLVIPLSVAMLWGKKGWFYNLVFLLMMAAMVICMLVTFSRGAWLGLMLAFGMFAVLRDRRILILCLVALLLMPFVLPQSILNRFASIGNLQDSSSAYRISVWLGSLRIVRDYWPSGIGLGTEAFKVIYPKYSYAAAYAHHAHNVYIQLMAELGAAGFGVFIVLLTTFYKTMLSSFNRTKDRFLSTFMIAVPSAVTGYLLQGMVDNVWYNYRVVMTFWVVLCLGMICYRLLRESGGADGETSGGSEVLKQ